MSTWPDPAATVPTTDLDDDNDSLTAARVDLLDAVGKLNQILGTCDQASTPWTDLNDTTIQKRITTGTTNGIVLEDANGDIITSGKTISTTITDTDAVVPTSGAVVDYVAANSAIPIRSDPERYLTATATYTFDHALGRVPVSCQLQATLISASDAGYSSGDVVYPLQLSDTAAFGYTIHTPAALTVKLSTRSSIAVVDKAGGGISALANNEWDLRIVVM